MKTKEQIESDDHYNAMRTIESIQAEMKTLHVRSMSTLLDSWLPIAINKLLYGARTEADGFISGIRSHVELIGNTILCRQAQLNVSSGASITGADSSAFQMTGRRGSATSGRQINNNVNSNNVSNSTAEGATKNGPVRRASVIRNGGSAPAAAAYSTSLLHIINHSKVFNLTSWAKSTEFDNAVPAHFSTALSAEGEEVVDAQLCALAPLHKVLHLYAVLGDLNAYHEHYRALRGDFLRNILDKAERAANQNGISTVLPRLFDKIVGFFTIECAHRRCVEIAEGAFSFAELATLWEDACAAVTKICTALAITVTSPDELIRIKEDILLLIDVATDDAYGFSPKPLYAVMRGMWEIFRGLQISSVITSCNDALDMCAYQPYSSTTPQQYQTQVRAFMLDTVEPADEETGARNNRRRPTLKDRETKREKTLQTGKAAENLDALEEELRMSIGSSSPKAGGGTSSNGSSGGRRKSLTGGEIAYPAESGGGRVLTRGNAFSSAHHGGPTPTSAVIGSGSAFVPKTFPFSFAVPLLLRELNILIIRFFLFAVKNADLEGRSEDICIAIVSVFEAICKSLKRELNKDGIETPLSKACQIAIDGASLMSASDSLWLMVENGLKHFHWTENLDRYLQTGIEAATSCLRQLVLSAQDLIFELLSNKIDGLMESLAFINFVPEVVPDGPHESVESIVEFLKVTLMWLEHLPPSVRDAVHFTCCTRVAQGILNYIISPAVGKINMLCILAFDYDLKMLVQFADSCGVPHLKQCFEELHELVRCLLHPNLTHYADNAELRAEHFPYTQTAKLVIVLEKVC